MLEKIYDLVLAIKFDQISDGNGMGNINSVNL